MRWLEPENWIPRNKRDAFKAEIKVSLLDALSIVIQPIY